MRIPTLPTLADLAAALGTDLDTLLAGAIDAEPQDRIELRRIVALLDPLSDEPLRAVHAMRTARLDVVAAGACATRPSRKREG